MTTYTIRDATTSDLPHIRAINIHYILNTVLTFRRTPPPLATIIDKYNDIKARRLPYLVAVDSNLKHHADDSDLVLGYAYLSPYRGDMLSYASTVEPTLFVHPDHQSKSIGSDLLASILQAAKTVLHCAHEISTEVHDEAVPIKVTAGEYGLGVFVRNVLAVMAVDTDGPDEGDALRGWYVKRGFVEKGRLEKIGFKKGRW